MLSPDTQDSNQIKLDIFEPHCDNNPEISKDTLKNYGVDSFFTLKGRDDSGAPCGFAGQSILIACGEADFYG